MEVAEQRKAAEAERTKAAETRQQYEQTLTETSNRLDAWTKFMESQVGQSARQVDAGLRHDRLPTPDAEYKARRDQLQQAYAARQQLDQEQARQRQAWINERATATEKS
jgi:hypothetical protein